MVDLTYRLVLFIIRAPSQSLKTSASQSGQALLASRGKLPATRLTQGSTRKSRHRRQLSDSKIPAFSPIKEDKDFESELAHKIPYKSFEYESIDDALRSEGMLGMTGLNLVNLAPRPSTALGTFHDSGTTDRSSMAGQRYHIPELHDTLIGDYPSSQLRRGAGSNSDWYLARRSSDGKIVGLEQLGRSSSQEGLYWTDGRHGRHYYVSQQDVQVPGLASYREQSSSTSRKSRKPRSWHPSPYVSEDEDDQLTREEKKQKIKAEIARRRRQIEENARLHDELLRLARAREHAAAKLQATAAAAAAAASGSVKHPLSTASSVMGTAVPSYASSYELGATDRRIVQQQTRPIDQSRSMPSISSQAEFREAGSVLKSIDEILQYDNYGKPAYEVYSDVFGKTPPASHATVAFGHSPGQYREEPYDTMDYEPVYQRSHQGHRPTLRYSLSAEDESIDRIASTFSQPYEYLPAEYYQGYGDYSPITTDIDTPPDFTPAMPLLPDMPSRSRKLLKHLGSIPITDSINVQAQPSMYFVYYVLSNIIIRWTVWLTRPFVLTTTNNLLPAQSRVDIGRNS